MNLPGRLAGWRVLVTRQPDQAGDLVESLRQEGALVVEVPLIETVPADDPRPLQDAVRQLAEYDWIAFTSANAVKAVVDALDAAGLERALRVAVGIASVGPSTTAALAAAFPATPATLMPAADFRAEGLAAAFEPVDVDGQRVLLPVSASARDTLAVRLRARGARVDVVVGYRTVVPAQASARLADALGQGVDVVAFASPSAVQGFVSACPPGLRWPPAAVIGPVTEAAARDAGFDVRAVAARADAGGLAQALARLTHLG